mgnify:CR=1 FL=1|tara:strand:- start:260 stop:439 length:180 start_codon:yes stop_codon:yes gene_type:complete
MKKVYLIGHHANKTYEIDGIFECEKTAVRECLTGGFVMPIELNVKAPSESVEVGYYPHG